MPTPYLNRHARYETNRGITMKNGVMTTSGYIGHFRHNNGLDLPVAVTVARKQSLPKPRMLGGKYIYALPGGGYYVP